MNNENCFKFKLLKLYFGVSSKGKKYCRITLFCDFGFLVDIFPSIEVGEKIQRFSQQASFDINKFIRVGFNSDNKTFYYRIVIPE